MKKRKFFLSLLLSVTLIGGGAASSVSVFAEEGQETEQTSETGTEHTAAYEEAVATNEIRGWPQGDKVNADAAIVMDAHTGAILYSKNIERKEYPASITKIMTALLALEKGNLSDVVKFSEYAVYSIEYGSSHLGLTEGEELTLEDCLYGIMLASANEISNAVAEHIGGNINGFVQMMNERAAELGCTNTHFSNVHGLQEEEHYVCARDMALIMQAALKNEKFREIIGTVEYHFDETNLVDEKRYFMNHHKMISEEGMLYDGCIGGKNGFTDDAGNTLVTAAARDGLEVICVVLRENGMYESYNETKLLLNYAFANFKAVQLRNADEVKTNTEIVGIEDAAELAKIQSADLTKEPFSIAETTEVTLPNGIEASALTKKMDFTAGTLTYFYEGQPLGSTSFTYTGQWEPETQAPTESETEMVTEPAPAVPSWAKEGTAPGTVYAYGKKALGGLGNLYERMDTFIKENTIVAALIGAVLLFIFIPLLLVSISRNRKYKRIMELREEELEVRRRLEAEIEKKSAAQVEAELKAEELKIRLEEEQKKRRLQEETIREMESAEGFYLDDEENAEEAKPKTDGAAENAGEPSQKNEESAAEREADEPYESRDLPEAEDEFIEVPLDEVEKNQ